VSKAAPISDPASMVAGMSPVLDVRAWRFIAVKKNALPDEAFALIREDEGLTAIVAADIYGDGAAFARITLRVHSALEGVGLTVAVSGALADAGIACNIVAGLHHDHVLVPWERRDEALRVLHERARRAAIGGTVEQGPRSGIWQG
jgi:uncharacterized protein